MAYEIAQVSEGNVDTPLTNFPVSKDTFGRMQDVTISLLPLVLQYNQFYSNGDFASASQLINDNPDLDDCLHNAKKWNQLRDAVIAMEDFLLNQVDKLYNTVAQNAVGIVDEPTEEQASNVAYSAKKVNELISSVNTTIAQLNAMMDSANSAISNINSKISNVDNTADADKNVSHAETATSADSATQLATARTIQTNLGATTAASFNGTENVSPGVTGTLGVPNGGTGATTFTSGAVLIGNGANAVTTRDITNITKKGAVTGSENIATANSIAFWDGSYNSSRNSNLTYCVKGTFGSIVTKNSTDYAAASHNQAASTITEGTLAGKVLANATAVATVGNKQVRNISAGTTELTSGSSTLTSGDIYLMYE